MYYGESYLKNTNIANKADYHAKKQKQKNPQKWNLLWLILVNDEEGWKNWQRQLCTTVLLQKTNTNHLIGVHEWAKSSFGPELLFLVVFIIKKKKKDYLEVKNVKWKL